MGVPQSCTRAIFIIIIVGFKRCMVSYEAVFIIDHACTYIKQACEYTTVAIQRGPWVQTEQIKS